MKHLISSLCAAALSAAAFAGLASAQTVGEGLQVIHAGHLIAEPGQSARAASVSGRMPDRIPVSHESASMLSEPRIHPSG